MRVKRDIKRPYLVDRVGYENAPRRRIFKLATDNDKLLYIYIPADGRSADTIIVSGKAPIKKYPHL